MEKVLFICPFFFNYHILIKEEFEKQNCEVFLFNDRPDEKFLTKAFVRINKNILKRKICKYQNKILSFAESNRIDKVIVILGQSFDNNFIIKLKKILNNAEFVYYTWDALSNYPNLVEMSKSFDRAYSFDKSDCEKYKHLKFLPLFYSNFIKPKIWEEKKDEALVVATIKKGKISALNEICKEVSKYSNVKKIFYLQSRIVYLFYKLTLKEFNGMHMTDFVYKRIPYDECCSLIMNSKYIIDVPMINQHGLTIRTFEALNAGSKLITTNRYTCDYNFFNPEYILVYNQGSISEFFKKKDETFIIHDMENYSISNFCKNLLIKEL